MRKSVVQNSSSITKALPGLFISSNKILAKLYLLPCVVTSVIHYLILNVHRVLADYCSLHRRRLQCNWTHDQNQQARNSWKEPLGPKMGPNLHFSDFIKMQQGCIKFKSTSIQQIYLLANILSVEVLIKSTIEINKHGPFMAQTWPLCGPRHG